MKIPLFLLSALIGLFFLPAPLQAKPSLPAQLATQIDQHDILLLGEQHGREEATRLMVQTVDHYTAEGQCLTVALEIYSSQQPAIRKAMQGAGSINDIQISTIIDHPSYREMLNQFAEWIQAGRCLKVIAADGSGNNQTRDEQMAQNLHPYLQKEKILFLVGKLHAIKKVRWERGADRPFLGEILQRQGYDVCTVMQIWDKKEGQGMQEISLQDVEQVLDPTSAIVPADPKEIGDFAIWWE